MSGSKGLDDLWLGVICQSNPEIAGSPRNIFRYSGVVTFWWGRALNGGRVAISYHQSNSEYAKTIHQSVLPG